MNATRAPALPTLISVSEAAQHLGLAKRTVYVLLATGQLVGCRVGRRILVPTEDLQRFVAVRRTVGPEATP